MLSITIPASEYYDEVRGEFFSVPETRLRLEHSLAAISRWESKWLKPFFGNESKTPAECADYVRCMAIDEDVNPDVFRAIPPKIFDEIDRYIESPMTATTIRERPGRRGGREIVTSELIYYWMVALGIPFECDRWNINRLLMLIRITNIRQAPQKNMSRKDIYSQNRAINAARRAKLGSKG